MSFAAVRPYAEVGEPGPIRASQTTFLFEYQIQQIGLIAQNLAVPFSKAVLKNDSEFVL
jgi:hypothetical protein